MVLERVSPRERTEPSEGPSWRTVRGTGVPDPRKARRPAGPALTLGLCL